MKLKWTKFVKSGTAPEHFPDWGVSEVAFAGRSNVGKSSLINTLVGHNKLVKVSKTPGRTRLLNFFLTCLGDDRELGLVDLPGYGFAKVSANEKRKWQKMIEGYLQRREELRALLLLMDIRRGMTDLDQQLLESMGHFGVQPILVFTKADKLSRNKRYNARQALGKQLGINPKEILFFSSLSGLGKDALWDRIVETALPARSSIVLPDDIYEEDESEEGDDTHERGEVSADV